MIHAKQTSPQFPDPGEFSIIHEVGGLTTNIRTTLFGLCEKMLKGWAEGGATSQLLSKTDTTSLFRISYHIQARYADDFNKRKWLHKYYTPSDLYIHSFLCSFIN